MSLFWNHGRADSGVGRHGYHGVVRQDVAVVYHRLTVAGYQPVSGYLELVVYLIASVRLRAVQCLVAGSAQICLLMLFWQTIVSVVPGDDGPGPDPGLVFVLVLVLVFFLAGFEIWIVVWIVVPVVVWVLPSAFLLLLLLRFQ